MDRRFASDFPICRSEFSDFALRLSHRAVNSAAASHFSEFGPAEERERTLCCDHTLVVAAKEDDTSLIR